MSASSIQKTLSEPGKMSTCPSCGKESSELHFLPCLHVLCLSCICSQKNDESCPFCSQNQTIPRDVVFQPKFSGEFQCDYCTNCKDSRDFWFCEDCVSLTCSFCWIQNHKTHSTHQWADGSQTVQQILNKLQTLSQGVGDDLGNRGKWRELILPVIRALAILVKDKAASVGRLSKHVQEAYHLPAAPELLSADGEGSQSLASGQEEKLYSNLKVLGQLLNLAKAPDPSLTRRVRGFKCSPEEVAQLIFDKLDFGEEAPAAGKSESAQLLDKPFYLRKEKEPVVFVFGFHWALVILWEDAAEIWNIRDREADGLPVLIGHIKCEGNQTFRAAAVCDQETIAPSVNSRLYILAHGLTRWSILIINLNTGVQVDKGCFNLFTDKNIVSGQIACSPTNAVAMVALNYANQQWPCKLFQLESKGKREFGKNPILSVKNLAVLNMDPENEISLVATKNHSDPTAINLYLLCSVGIQPLSKISQNNDFFTFFWVPGRQTSLWVRDEKTVNLWEVGIGEAKLVQSAAIDAKSAAVVGLSGGRFVAASATKTQESDPFLLQISFFQENQNGFSACASLMYRLVADM